MQTSLHGTARHGTARHNPKHTLSSGVKSQAATPTTPAAACVNLMPAHLVSAGTKEEHLRGRCLRPARPADDG
jgi:hypothetical protein